MGCMRLSTERDRDERSALAVVHAALDAGVRLLDTADAYCWDDSETGHNERLLRRALSTWPGPREEVTVATKGGLRRPGGRWLNDARGKQLAEACAESRRSLGMDRLELYLLHTPDPRVPLATSVRALLALQQQGQVARIGLSNVSLRQLEEARTIAPISAVQIELSPFREDGFRSGVPEYCVANGIQLIAHRPLGGADQRDRLERDPLLRELAQAHGATPQQLVLAWLLDLSDLLVPIPGPTRLESAQALARAGGIRLRDEDRDRLDARFPAGRLLRSPRSSRRPPADEGGDVVLVMGLPGAGKSTLARGLVEQGYERLNRDEAGGRLADLLPALGRALASGRRRVVLDNTYTTRHSRNAVIEKAWEHGAPVRCVWLKTSLEDAQVNATRRMLDRYGRLLGPEEIKAASKKDPGVFGPGAQFRHQRELDPPGADEGFSRVDEAPFERRADEDRSGRALLLWYDGVLRASRSGARTPASPDDVAVLPGRAEELRRWSRDGYLLLGVSWHPEIAMETADEEQVRACLARTHELLGVEMEALFCPHGDGPPVCWCRKPLPGLGVAFIERHRLDPARCFYVGEGSQDRSFAQRLGFQYRHPRDFFAAAPALA
jgi:aryl-alcohol dehydrogenase-like predicted oxidoreductase/histidinol phosphatase-like enzyme